MKTTFKVGALCGLVSLFAMAGVQAQDYSNTFTFGGDVELDLTGIYPKDSNDTFDHGGRIKLNAVGEAKRGGYFVTAVAQPLVPLKGSDLGYDDVFLQFGQSSWDLQLGRFEALDVFPVGKDTVAIHAGGLSHYGANSARGRKDDVLHGAVHVKPMQGVTLEMGAMYKKDGDNSFTAFRPAVVGQVGAVTVRAAYENIKDELSNAPDHTGYGLSAGVGFGGGQVNASIAQTDNDSGDVTSAALNYTQGPFGVGYIHSQFDAEGPKPKVDTGYAAYTVPLFGMKDASMTFAGSTSKAKNVATDKTVNAVRVRFNYAF